MSVAGATNVLVTGGTGKTGRHVVEALKRHGVASRVAARRPPLAGDAVRFDWMDEGTHDDALAGVDGVYLVAPAGVPDPFPAMSGFIARAVARGVRRFVLLTSSAIPIDGPVLGGVHRYLADHAPEWAVLRPSWFFENFTEEHHGDTIRRQDCVFSATGDAAIAFIGAADIAAAGAACLVANHAPNRDVLLTGPASHSYDEMAAIVSARAGRTIRHIRLGPPDLARKFVEFGLDENYAAILARLDSFLAEGGEARTTDEVEALTGAPATSFEDFAREHEGSWKL